MSRQNKTRYYSSFDDDFEASANQDYKLDDDYLWIKTDLLSKIKSVTAYTAALVFSSVYCRLFLHMHIKNASVLRRALKTGGFVYVNHTQPVGDVFIPALACFPGRIYTVVSPANYGIPVIGKILPYLGALPIPDTKSGMRKFSEAVSRRAEQNKFIVNYPEAHVWEYCNFIRPFGDTAFKFPVKCGKPVFCLTVTYNKRRFGKKPRMTVYADGPFLPDSSLPPGKQAAGLKAAVFEKMCERSRTGDSEYISYKKR